jgi:hypothetical protein
MTDVKAVNISPCDRQAKRKMANAPKEASVKNGDAPNFSTDFHVGWPAFRTPGELHFFYCLGSADLGKIPQNRFETGCSADIPLAGSVQKIFKKVKKRLVSPRKPR